MSFKVIWLKERILWILHFQSKSESSTEESYYLPYRLAVVRGL